MVFATPRRGYFQRRVRARLSTSSEKERHWPFHITIPFRHCVYATTRSAGRGRNGVARSFVKLSAGCWMTVIVPWNSSFYRFSNLLSSQARESPLPLRPRLPKIVHVVRDHSFFYLNSASNSDSNPFLVRSVSLWKFTSEFAETLSHRKYLLFFNYYSIFHGEIARCVIYVANGII